MNRRPRKRLLILLLAAGLTVMVAATAGLVYLVTFWPHVLSRTLRLVVLAGIVLAVPLFSVGLIGLVLTLASGRSFPTLARPIAATINSLLPLAVVLGRFTGHSREEVHRSFIEINNRLVGAAQPRVDVARLLVLAPHCLQWENCPHRVSGGAVNCRQCGQCIIGDLIGLQEKVRFQMCIATGGGQAREAVRTVRPQAIIAIACERELVSGVQDVTGIPVVGVLNQTPNGPCVNTSVDLAAVRQSIRELTGGDSP